MFWTQLFYKQGQSDPKMVCDTPPSNVASTHLFGILTFNNIRNALDTIFLKTRSEVKVTVTHKMIQDTPPSQDAFIHQNWDSYLK